MRSGVCPVCGKHEFEDDYEKCPVCGWWHDTYQEKRPDTDVGANAISLNQAKKLYEAGRIDKIRTHQHYDGEPVRLDGADAVRAGLTPGELRYMGRLLGDRLFHAGIPSMDALKKVYPILKSTHTDSAEDDELRVGLINKLSKII